MKILLICSEYPLSVAGGQGHAMRTMASLLRQAGHEVRVAGIYPASMRHHLVPDDESFYPVWQGGWPQAWRLARRQLYQLVKRWAEAGEIDLVEVPFSRGWIAGWKWLPVPVVSRVHGSLVIKNKYLGKKVAAQAVSLERRGLARADAVSAVSEAVTKDLRDCFAYDGQVTVIPNPVAIPERSWQPTQPREVVFAGKLIEAKGIDLMLTAWQQISGHEHDVELHLYGRVDPSFSVKDHLTEALAARVTVHGAVDNETLQRAYRQATVAVFPSRYETFGLAQAEAMANGCPVVVSWHGAGAELVCHDRDGLVCKPLGAVTLADCVCRLLDCEELRKKVGPGGRRRIATLCDPQKVVDETVAFYQDVIANF